MWELQCLLLATGSVYDRVFSVSLRRSWSQSVEGGSSTVQLHSTQLLRILTWGADEDRCHFLAKLPPGEALWWKLCLLLSPLLRLPVCPCQGHEEIPWGKYQHVNNSETFTYTVVKFWNECQFRIKKHFTSRVIFLNYLIYYYNIFPTDISSETIFWRI